MAERSWLFQLVCRGINASGPWSKDAMDTMLGDVAYLPELTGDELTEAEDLAIAKLREGDSRGALVLGDAGCARAVPALIEMAESPSAGIAHRLRAAHGLLKLGHQVGRAVAIEIMRDTGLHKPDRRAAIRMLGEHPDEATVAVLEETSTDPDPDIRYEAVGALITARGGG